MKKSFAFLEKVIDKFKKVATSQEMKGLEKYGQTLDPMDDQWDWLNMAEEELIDGYKYLNAERQRRDTFIVEALNDLEGMKERYQSLFTTIEIESVQNKLFRISKNVIKVPIESDCQFEKFEFVLAERWINKL